jgi:hypothetical protein
MTYKLMEKTAAEKKAILKKHYTMDEICEIMGFFDGSNETVCTDEFNDLHAQAEFTNEPTDWDKFEDRMLDEAIINGNFEEVIENDVRYPL